MEEQKNKDTENGLQKLVISVTAIIVIFLVIVLLIIKATIPTFPVWQIFLYSFVIIVIGIGVYYFIKWYSKNKNKIKNKEEDKLPPAITIEQAREIAQKAVQNPTYADYIPNCLGEKIYNLGKNKKSRIYKYMAKGKYEKDTYVILINMHYPNELQTILISPKSADEIYNAMMLLAINPEDDIEPRIIVNRNLLTGAEQVIKEPAKKDVDTKQDKLEEDI